MKNRSKKQQRASKPRAIPLIVVALVILAFGGWWLWPDRAPSPGGAAKLALDRTEIDLGYLRFGTPAYAAFTLTNAGDGLLRIEPGPVRVVQGC